MIRHIEFCLDEIEWELRAQGPDGLLFDEKVVLRDHISRMRTVLAKYRDRPEKYAIARLGNDNTENVGVDDLTLIQGVDLAVATRLKEIGVSKFETIADWRVEDVLQFANETLSPERISQQNWIEQAAILATGKLTHHARRVRRGDLNCVVHVACKVNEAAALVDEPNEAQAEQKQDPTAIARLGNDNTENVGVDDLTLIQGVDLAVATRLKEIGVSKFETIADWRVEDVLQFANETLSPERISQQNWIEQAAILATGKLTHHARRVQRGDINCVVHIACKVNEAAALVDEPNEAQAEQKQGAGDVKTDFKISDSPILSVEAMKSHGSPATPHESRSVKAAHNVILFNPAEIHRIRRSRIRIAASLLLVAALTLVACLLNSPALALS